MPTDEWSLCQITKSYFETDDFKKAQKKLKLCQYLSDVASESEQSISNVTNKRQRNKPLKYITSDSSGEENIPVLSKLKAPPRLDKSFPICVEGPSIIEDKVLNASTAKTDDILVTTNHLVQPTRKHTLTEKNFLSATNTENVESQIDNRTLRDIYATLAFLKRQNADIYNQNDQILQIIKETNNSIVTTSKSNEKLQLPCTLPMTTLEDIIKLEEYLEKEENIFNLVNLCVKNKK
ncbi:uncharacterized protein LOC118645276 [Monomorium pharaonis]|uniref:uncharacterized protein LOC118645276 n=1 Tax=Monomorium pharaonis TaxID=307658 RepID=UPI0017473962|nr:uncharacterized protein LOC118645276 [Monomorium pharaonis]